MIIVINHRIKSGGSYTGGEWVELGSGGCFMVWRSVLWWSWFGLWCWGWLSFCSFTLGDIIGLVG